MRQALSRAAAQATASSRRVANAGGVRLLFARRIQQINLYGARETERSLPEAYPLLAAMQEEHFGGTLIKVIKAD